MTKHTITLRPLVAGDAPALLAFYNGLSNTTIRTFRPLREKTTLSHCEKVIQANLCEPPQRHDLAAWHETVMVGWASLDKLNHPRPHLGLGIADVYQGRGLGGALLDELLQWAQGRGIDTIELMVVNDNAHAIHLYSSRGFTITKEAYDDVDKLTYLYMNLCLDGPLPVHIQAWPPNHPRWAQLKLITDALEQTRWVQVRFDWHLESHLLVATKGGRIVGFLRLVTQPIGSDDELPPTQLHGKSLIEAKVMAFAVVESERRQGVGRSLQLAALRMARELGCYQLRSHSSGDKTANHQLKLAMGFALHRIVRGEDHLGGYFIMPL